MRKLILITAAILFIGFTSFSQQTAYSERLEINKPDKNAVDSKELRFDVRGNYNRPVIKETLIKAKVLGDIIPHYPVNWINHYLWVEVSVTTNVKVLKVKGKDDVLTLDQIKILSSAELTSEIGIKVKYKAKNSVTGVMEDHLMNVEMTVVPEVEADFIGGKDQIRKYFNEFVISKLSSMDIEPSVVIFSISETGQVVNPFVKESTGNEQVDKFLIETITKMPKWIPAQNSEGKKVQQDFVFLIEYGGC